MGTKCRRTSLRGQGSGGVKATAGAREVSQGSRRVKATAGKRTVSQRSRGKRKVRARANQESFRTF